MAQAERPSLDAWLAELKAATSGRRVGMYLVHNGVVRDTSRTGGAVAGMKLTVDRTAEEAAVQRVAAMPGVAGVRLWINEGLLRVGDDIMLAMVAGDIREHVFAALQSLVTEVKSVVVKEQEVA